MGSLTTRDPGDVREAVQAAVNQHIQCHVISLTSDVSLYRNLAKQTDGKIFISSDKMQACIEWQWTKIT